MADIKSWSVNAGENNLASPDGWPENMLRSGLNNSGREMMAAIAAWYADPEWHSLGSQGTGYTRVDDTIVQINGIDVVSSYPAGARVRVLGTPNAYGTVASASLSGSDTRITVTWDDGGVTPTSPLDVARQVVTTMGTAAFEDTGAGSDQLPKVSDLGDAVLLNQGHDPEGDGTPGIDADTVDAKHYTDIQAYAESVRNINLLVNPEFRFWQALGPTPVAQADLAYFADQWKLLAETSGAVTLTRTATTIPAKAYNGLKAVQAVVEDSSGSLGPVTNAQWGIYQMVETRESIHLREEPVYASIQARLSSTSTSPAALGFAIIQWTGSEDAPAADPVATWPDRDTKPFASAPTLTAGFTYVGVPTYTELSTGTVVECKVDSDYHNPVRAAHTVARASDDSVTIAGADYSSATLDVFEVGDIVRVSNSGATPVIRTVASATFSTNTTVTFDAGAAINNPSNRIEVLNAPVMDVGASNIGVMVWVDDSTIPVSQELTLTQATMGLGERSRSIPYESDTDMLARCHRFYWKTFPLDTPPANDTLSAGPPLSASVSDSGGARYPVCAVRFPTRMVKPPLWGGYNVVPGTDGAWQRFDSTGTNPRSVVINSGSITEEGFTVIGLDGMDGAAQAICHVTADASFF